MSIVKGTYILLLFQVTNQLEDTLFERLLVPYDVYRNYDKTVEDEVTGPYKPSYYREDYIPDPNCDLDSCSFDFTKELNLILKSSFGTRLVYTDTRTQLLIPIDIMVAQATMTVMIEPLFIQPKCKVVHAWTYENYDDYDYNECKTNMNWKQQVEPSGVSLSDDYKILDSKYYLKSGSGGSFNPFTAKCGHYWLTTLYMCIRKSIACTLKEHLTVYKISDEADIDAVICVKLGADKKVCNDIKLNNNDPIKVDMEDGIELEIKPIGSYVVPHANEGLIAHVIDNKLVDWYHLPTLPNIGSPNLIGLGSFQVLQLKTPLSLIYNPDWLVFDNVISLCDDLKIVEKSYTSYEGLSPYHKQLEIAISSTNFAESHKTIFTKSLNSTHANLLNARSCMMCSCCINTRTPTNDQIKNILLNYRKSSIVLGQFDAVLPNNTKYRAGSVEQDTVIYTKMVGPATQATLGTKNKRISYPAGFGKVSNLTITDYKLVIGSSGSYFSYSFDYTGQPCNLPITSKEVVPFESSIFTQGSGKYRNKISIKAIDTAVGPTEFCISDTCVIENPELIDPPKGGMDDPETSGGNYEKLIDTLSALLSANYLFAFTVVLIWILDAIVSFMFFKTFIVILLLCCSKTEGAKNNNSIYLDDAEKVEYFSDPFKFSSLPITSVVSYSSLEWSKKPQWLCLSATNDDFLTDKDHSMMYNRRGMGTLSFSICIKDADGNCQKDTSYESGNYLVHPRYLTDDGNVILPKIRNKDASINWWLTTEPDFMSAAGCIVHQISRRQPVVVCSNLTYTFNTPYGNIDPVICDTLSMPKIIYGQNHIYKIDELTRSGNVLSIRGVSDMVIRSKNQYKLLMDTKNKLAMTGDWQCLVTTDYPMYEMHVLYNYHILCVCEQSCFLSNVTVNNNRFGKDQVRIEKETSRKILGFRLKHTDLVSGKLIDPEYDVTYFDIKNYKLAEGDYSGRTIVHCTTAGNPYKLCKSKDGYVIIKSTYQDTSLHTIMLGSKSYHMTMSKHDIKISLAKGKSKGKLYVNNKGEIGCTYDHCDVSFDDWETMERFEPGKVIDVPEEWKVGYKKSLYSLLPNYVSLGMFGSTVKTRANMMFWSDGDYHALPYRSIEPCNTNTVQSSYFCFSDRFPISYLITILIAPIALVLYLLTYLSIRVVKGTFRVIKKPKLYNPFKRDKLSSNLASKLFDTNEEEALVLPYHSLSTKIGRRTKDRTAFLDKYD